MKRLARWCSEIAPLLVQARQALNRGERRQAPVLVYRASWRLGLLSVLRALRPGLVRRLLVAECEPPDWFGSDQLLDAGLAGWHQQSRRASPPTLAQWARLCWAADTLSRQSCLDQQRGPDSPPLTAEEHQQRVEAAVASLGRPPDSYPGAVIRRAARASGLWPQLRRQLAAWKGRCLSGREQQLCWNWLDLLRAGPLPPEGSDDFAVYWAKLLLDTTVH